MFLEPVSGRRSTMACHVRGTFPDCEHNKSSGAPFPWLCLLPRLTNVPQLKALCRHCGLKFQVAQRVPLRSRNLRSGNHLSFISRKPAFRHSETSLPDSSMSFLALEKVNGFVKDSLVARFSTNDDRLMCPFKVSGHLVAWSSARGIFSFLRKIFCSKRRTSEGPSTGGSHSMLHVREKSRWTCRTCRLSLVQCDKGGGVLSIAAPVAGPSAMKPRICVALNSWRKLVPRAEE